jgi:hypothetical protein
LGQSYCGYLNSKLKPKIFESIGDFRATRIGRVGSIGQSLVTNNAGLAAKEGWGAGFQYESKSRRFHLLFACIKNRNFGWCFLPVAVETSKPLLKEVTLDIISVGVPFIIELSYINPRPALVLFSSKQRMPKRRKSGNLKTRSILQRYLDPNLIQTSISTKERDNNEA